MNGKWPIRLSILLVLTMSLGACATARSDDAYWGAVAQTYGAAVAPPVRAWSADERRRAAEELAALPPGSVIAGQMMPDYLRMRDQARAIRGVAK